MLYVQFLQAGTPNSNPEQNLRRPQPPRDLLVVAAAVAPDINAVQLRDPSLSTKHAGQRDIEFGSSRSRREPLLM